MSLQLILGSAHSGKTTKLVQLATDLSNEDELVIVLSNEYHGNTWDKICARVQRVPKEITYKRVSSYDDIINVIAKCSEHSIVMVDCTSPTPAQLRAINDVSNALDITVYMTIQTNAIMGKVRVTVVPYEIGDDTIQGVIM